MAGIHPLSEAFQADLLIIDVVPDPLDAVVFVDGIMEGLDHESPATVYIRRILSVTDADHRVVAGISRGMLPLQEAGYFKGHSIANLKQIEHEFTIYNARHQVTTSSFQAD
ncbi:MAG: hypothetical protein P8K08_21995 [Fuerstiella sp.]|nr:hypothetical protein [Fuerstiella sp.]